MPHLPHPSDRCDRPDPSDPTDSPASARLLTVVARSSRRDVAVDPRLGVRAVLDELFPGWAGVVTTTTGQVLRVDETVERAGLVDGSVVVAAGTGAAQVPRPLLPADARDAAEGDGDPGGGPTRGWAPPGSLAAHLVVGWVLAVPIVALAVVGLPEVGVPPVGSAALVLATAAAVSRVVPDLVLRWSPPASLGVADEPPHDRASVQQWVRRLASRQLRAHVAVLVAALVADGVLLVATTRMPVGPAGSGPAPVALASGWSVTVPVLSSVLVSAMVLAGSVRGRSRADGWVLRAASAAAVVPVVVAGGMSLSTPVAVTAAYGSVVVGLVVLSPAGRWRSPRSWPRAARAIDLLLILAVLPAACWAAGLVEVVQSWVNVGVT